MVLRRDALRATRWVLLEAVAKNLVLLGFAMVLARLLTPAEFGIVAMMSLFVGVGSALAEGGMGAALIQAKSPTQSDISTVFWAQLGLAVLLGATLVACGPVLATWFGQPILASIAVAYAINLLIFSPASVLANLLAKALQFRSLTLIAIAAQMIAGVAAVSAALCGAGPWAIVLQAITGSAVTTALLWKISSWRPSVAFSLDSLRRLASFGVYVVGTGILAEVELRVGSLAIGRFAGPADTGQFQRGSSLQLLLSRLLSGVVTRIAYPVFAVLQDDRHRLTKAIREAAFINFAVTAMAMWTVALVAEPLMRFVFGAPWAPGAPVLQAMCLAGGFYPVFAVFSKALRAIGRARAVFIHQVVRATGMAVIAFSIGSAGYVTLAWAQAIFLILTLPMGSYGVARWASYHMRDQLADLFPIMVSGAAMAIVGVMVDGMMSTSHDLIRLVVVGATSAVTFIGSMMVFILALPLMVPRLALASLRSFLAGEHSRE